MKPVFCADFSRGNVKIDWKGEVPHSMLKHKEVRKNASKYKDNVSVTLGIHLYIATRNEINLMYIFNSQKQSFSQNPIPGFYLA